MFKKNRRRFQNLRFNIRSNQNSNSNLEALKSQGLLTKINDTTNHSTPSLLVSNNGDIQSRSVDELASFDACVEACDALAASSTSLIYGKNNTSDAISEKDGDCHFQLSDCFVRVSPDGELMFLPVQSGSSSSLLDEESNDEEDDENENENENENGVGIKDEESKEMGPESPQKDESFTLAHISQTGFESAVVVGNDQPGGDRESNGFSANGWSSDAAGMAFRQSTVALKRMSDFVEHICQSRKEDAQNMIEACDSIRQAVIDAPKTPVKSPTSSNQGMIRKLLNQNSGEDNFYAFGDYSNMAPGLGFKTNFPTLNSAIIAMEHYHAVTSEADLDRWNNISLPAQENSQILDELSHQKMILTGKSSLSQIQHMTQKTNERSLKREKALQKAQKHAEDAEEKLRVLKLDAKQKWDAVRDAEVLSREKISDAIQARRESIARERERKRNEILNQKDDYIQGNSPKNGTAPTDSIDIAPTPTQQEIWEMVSQVTDSFDQGSFAPTFVPPPPKVDDSVEMEDAAPQFITLTPMEQMQIEYDCNVPRLRSAAKAADECVEDAVGALLNALSILDTTTRSARIAVEAGLLSAANTQADCLRSMVEMEKASLQRKLKELENFENKVKQINIRSDLCQSIEDDKKNPENRSQVREDDDGGIASALAVLNGHRDALGGMSALEHQLGNVVLEGWGASDETGIVSREEIDKMIQYLFKSDPSTSVALKKNEDAEIPHNLNGIVSFVVGAVKDHTKMSRIHRAMVCSALNKQRSVLTEIKYEANFNGLCDILNSLLSGCDRQTDDIDNAKMCMILAQTFYRVDEDGLKNDLDTETEAKEESIESSRIEGRDNRIYVKDSLKGHSLWSDEHFWDQALFRCISDALTKSSVLRSFQETEDAILEWHDLNRNQRYEATAQLHAVISAQIGALAHSMVEFGGGTEGACAFVRRMSIRHQLPISKRTLLLQHLVSRGKS